MNELSVRDAEYINFELFYPAGARPDGKYLGFADERGRAKETSPARADEKDSGFSLCFAQRDFAGSGRFCFRVEEGAEAPAKMEIKIGYKDGAEFANRKYVLDCSHFPVIVARCALKGQKAPESGKSFLLGCRFYDDGRELKLDMFWQRANDLTPSKKYGYYRYLKIREGQRLNVDRRFVIPPRARTIEISFVKLEKDAEMVIDSPLIFEAYTRRGVRRSEFRYCAEKATNCLYTLKVPGRRDSDDFALISLMREKPDEEREVIWTSSPIVAPTAS